VRLDTEEQFWNLCIYCLPIQVNCTVWAKKNRTIFKSVCVDVLLYRLPGDEEKLFGRDPSLYYSDQLDLFQITTRYIVYNKKKKNCIHKIL